MAAPKPPETVALASARIIRIVMDMSQANETPQTILIALVTEAASWFAQNSINEQLPSTILDAHELGIA